MRKTDEGLTSECICRHGKGKVPVSPSADTSSSKTPSRADTRYPHVCIFMVDLRETNLPEPDEDCPYIKLLTSRGAGISVSTKVCYAPSIRGARVRQHDPCLFGREEWAFRRGERSIEFSLITCSGVRGALHKDLVPGKHQQ